jgi:RNA polymerase sporulation-specific sigma factor
MLTALLGVVSANIIYFILHLQNNGSFPRPLTPAEERICLKKMRDGDMESRNKLIEHNLRLVAHIIKKYYSNSKDQDDLVSIGTIGLIKAITTFDYEKGTRLATYAARCIDNEILMYFRGQKKKQQDVYISDPIDTDSEGNTLTLIDVIASEDTIIDDIDLKIKIENLYNYIGSSLNSREKSIIEMRYGLNSNVPMTQREVAKKLGISRSYVSRIEKKSLQQLKRRFDNDIK